MFVTPRPSLHPWLRALLATSLLACGGSAPRAAARGPVVTAAPAAPVTPALVPTIAFQRWYAVGGSPCAQGPFEVEIPIEGEARGEEIELLLHTPRAVALQAVIVADGQEVARASGVYTPAGVAAGGQADNARCVADARERAALVRGGAGGGGGPGGPGAPGGPGQPGGGAGTGAAPPLPAAPSAQLTPDEGAFATHAEIVRWRLPAGALPSVRIRFWSIEPNDVTGVRFGLIRTAWRPNVGEAAWQAHLAAEAERQRQEEARFAAEAERRRAEYEARRAAEAEQRRLRLQARLEAEEAERRRIAELRVRCRTEPGAAGCKELAAQDRRRAEIERERRAAWEAERLRVEEERKQAEARLQVQLEYERVTAEKRRLAAIEARRAEEEARRRRELQLALEAERARRRQLFCETHPDDRGCWGVGGKRVHLAMEAHAAARAAYCASHPEDARCWSRADRASRRAAWDARLVAVAQPPAPPDGPPPAALAEVMPPKLSLNATWRPGYWHWIDGRWVWLAGMWRVPESDIVAEQTTTAPAAPPPLQVEAPPPPPVTAAVWIAGFWQWSGTAWVWVPGAWQLRPSAAVEWRAPAWRAKGGVHILVPGAWIRAGGGR